MVKQKFLKKCIFVLIFLLIKYFIVLIIHLIDKKSKNKVGYFNKMYRFVAKEQF